MVTPSGSPLAASDPAQDFARDATVAAMSASAPVTPRMGGTTAQPVSHDHPGGLPRTTPRSSAGRWVMATVALVVVVGLGGAAVMKRMHSEPKVGATAEPPSPLVLSTATATATPTPTPTATPTATATPTPTPTPTATATATTTATTTASHRPAATHPGTIPPAPIRCEHQGPAGHACGGTELPGRSILRLRRGTRFKRMPMTRSPNRVFGMALFGSVAMSAALPQARAADDPMMQCIASSNKGLDLRRQGKLIDARPVLAACAAATCGADISAVCQKRLAEVGAALPTIVFLPKDGAGSDITGVKVTIDGASTSQSLDGRAIALDPGSHTFKFESVGQPAVEKSFVLVEGAKDRQERIEIGPHAPVSLAVTGGPQPTASTGHASGTQKSVGFVVGGVGVLGVAAGSLFGLMASSKWSASKNDCGSTSCPNRPAAVSEHDTAASDATLSTVAFVAGGAALAAGVILFLTAPHGTHMDTTGQSLQVTPSVGPDGASLSLHGAF